MKKIKTIEAIYNDKGKKIENKNVVIICEKCNTEYHLNFGANGMICCDDVYIAPKNI